MHFTSLSLFWLKCHFHNQNTSFFIIPQTNAHWFTTKTKFPASAIPSKLFHPHLACDIHLIALENIITIIYHKNIEVKPNTIHKIRIKYKTHLFHRKIIEIHIIPKISTNCG